MKENDKSTKKKGSNLGKKFEHNFRESAINQELFFLRLNDSDISYMGYQGVRFTPTNPADFLSFLNGNLFLLELKSTEYGSIGIQRTPEEEKKMIKFHQINDLIKYSLFENVNCGFVFNFREKEGLDEDTYYLSIQNFSNFLCDTDKKSINKLDIVQYGGIKISQKLKRTQYTYDVKKMLEDIIKYNKENKEY